MLIQKSPRLRELQAALAETHTKLEAFDPAIKVLQLNIKEAKARAQTIDEELRQSRDEAAAQIAADAMQGKVSEHRSDIDQVSALTLFATNANVELLDAALSKIKADQGVLRKETASAEKVLLEEVNAILSVAAERQARRVTELHAELIREGATLREWERNDVFVPRSDVRPAIPSVEAALALLPMVDELHVAVDVLQGFAPPGRDRWAEGREQLLASPDGVPTPETERREAAAA